MKVICDEHVSPKIVRAVVDLGFKHSTAWELQSVRGSEYQSKEDEDWVSAFAKAGGQGLISADRAMLQRPSLIKQISETGLVGVYVKGRWGQSDRVRQAAFLLFWWPTIRKTLESAPAGSAWLLPNGFTEDKDLREVRPFDQNLRSEAG